MSLFFVFKDTNRFKVIIKYKGVFDIVICLIAFVFLLHLGQSYKSSSSTIILIFTLF